jgi:hypothetical protein
MKFDDLKHVAFACIFSANRGRQIFVTDGHAIEECWAMQHIMGMYLFAWLHQIFPHVVMKIPNKPYSTPVEAEVGEQPLRSTSDIGHLTHKNCKCPIKFT